MRKQERHRASEGEPTMPQIVQGQINISLLELQSRNSRTAPSYGNIMLHKASLCEGIRRIGFQIENRGGWTRCKTI